MIKLMHVYIYNIVYNTILKYHIENCTIHIITLQYQYLQWIDMGNIWILTKSTPKSSKTSSNISRFVLLLWALGRFCPPPPSRG